MGGLSYPACLVPGGVGMVRSDRFARRRGRFEQTRRGGVRQGGAPERRCDDVLSCPVCGAAAPPGSTWCGQCYAVFPAPGTAPLPAVAAATGAAPAPRQTLTAPPWVDPGTQHYPPGWAAPAPPTDPSPPTATASPLSRRAVVLTIVAIAVGAVAMGVSSWLGRDNNLAPATYLRYAIVITLAVYAVVGLMLVTQITPSVRLRWTEGQPALGAAIGLLVGGGLSLVMLLLVSAASGHLAPDPRIVLLMSEGDAPHVMAAVLISCVAAPLVEEVLFRGLLLESQRFRGTAGAIWLSAAGFAVWHLNPAALRYYALLGALLGWLYTRRGLVCSMAAHLGFNGVLTVAALSVVLSPGATVNVGGLSAHLPSGWRAASLSDMPESLSNVGSVKTFRGPSGSALVFVAVPSPSMPTVDDIYDRLSSSGFTSMMPGHSDLRELRLPAGPAVEVVSQVHGDQVTIVFLPHAGESYELLMRGAGSAKARADLGHILTDLRVS